MNKPRENYVILLHKFCKYEKLVRPVYTLVNEIPIDSSVRIRVDAGYYDVEASAPTLLEAIESAAKLMFEILQFLPSIHSLPGVLRVSNRLFQNLQIL